MSHTERLKRYQRMANHQAKILFYGCDEKEANGFIPPEWAVYRARYGYACPSEERHIRFIMGIEGWP